MKYRNEDINNLMVLHFTIELLRYLTAYRIKPIEAKFIFRRFRSTYKNKLRVLALEMRIKKRGRNSLFWDLLLDKKVLIQFLYNPKCLIRYIPHFYRPIDRYTSSYISSWVVKPLLCPISSSFQWEFQASFSFPLSFTYFNLFKQIYIQLRIDIILFRLLMNLVYERYYYNPLTIIIHKFYGWVTISIDGNYVEETSIVPELAMQDHVSSLWVIEFISTLTTFDRIFFPMYIFDLLKDNRENIYEMKLLFYLKIKDNPDRQFNLSRITTKRYNPFVLNMILTYVNKISSILNKINMEDYYTDTEGCYFVIVVKSINPIRLPLFLSAVFNSYSIGLSKKVHNIEEEEVYILD